MDTHTQHTSLAELSSPVTPPPLHLPRQQPPVEEFPDMAPGLTMSTFRARQVWGGMAWRRAFPGRGDQSALARRMVGQLLADSARVDDARWVTAELVSNALRHSRSGRERGFFIVEVLLGADAVRIVVYDLGGNSSPDFTRTPGSAPEVAEGGRGLAGVRELAVRVGVAGDAVTGHAVWADLALVPEAATWREVDPVPAGRDAPVIIGGVACLNSARVAQQEAAGEVPNGRLAALREAVLAAAGRADSVDGEGAVRLDPPAGLREAS